MNSFNRTANKIRRASHEPSTNHTQAQGVTGYNYGYLDEQTKRMIRRALLKAVAIPGYQVPFGGREMPMPYGWGTGGVQITAAIIGQADTLKVIDQGADDTTNAVPFESFSSQWQARKPPRER